jgi:hypothetical protein
MPSRFSNSFGLTLLTTGTIIKNRQRISHKSFHAIEVKIHPPKLCFLKETFLRYTDDQESTAVLLA